MLTTGPKKRRLVDRADATVEDDALLAGNSIEPSFDRLPPDVVCCEILSHLVIDILCHPLCTVQKMNRRTPTDPRNDAASTQDDDEIEPEGALWGIHFDDEDPVDDFLVPQSLGMVNDGYYSAKDSPLRSEMKPCDLFGRFCRDVLRYPWFIFRSIRVAVFSGILLRAVRRNLDCSDLRDVEVLLKEDASFSLIQKLVAVRRKQVYLLQFPFWERLIGLNRLEVVWCWPRQFDSIQKNLSDHHFTSLVVGGEGWLGLTGESLALSSFKSLKNLSLVNLYSEEASPLSDLARWVTGGFEQLQRLEVVGPMEGYYGLPSLSRLEEFSASGDWETPKELSELECPLRSLYLECVTTDTSIKAALPFAALTQLTNLKLISPVGDHIEDRFLIRNSDFDGQPPLQHLKNVSIIRVTAAGTCSWLSPSLGIRSLRIIHLKGSRLILEGMSLREADFIAFENVDCHLVEGGDPQATNAIVVLQESTMVTKRSRPVV